MNLRLLFVAAVAVICLSANTSFARLRPGFGLENNSWSASDIILVRDDGKLRPRVTVVETWKGSLRPGDSIVVSGLLAADAPKPKLDPDITAFPDASEGGFIVFFLSHRANAGAENRTDGKWSGLANDDRFLYTSAAFVRNGSVLRFRMGGSTSFSPDTLQSSGMTDVQFKAEVQLVLKAQDDLRKAAAIMQLDERAKALLPIVKNGHYSAQREAIPKLGECGPPAVPMLRDLVITSSKHCPGDGYATRVSFERGITAALVVAAGPDRARELTAIIVEELAYWKKTAPSLSEGWWNRLPSADVPRSHYDRLYFALENLRGFYKPTANDPVKQLRDLWISLPQLNDKSGPNQMIEACDAVTR